MAQSAGSPDGRTTTAPVVLVVEDDPDTGALLSDLLGDAGYAVQVEDTAFGVLGEVGRLRPCVIVLDLGLPFRSGAALLADLKANPITAHIPVVVVSALLETLPRERAALAATLLAKPFDGPDLLAAVQAASALGPPVAA
jgi:CheY-like chemotaxis protein